MKIKQGDIFDIANILGLKIKTFDDCTLIQVLHKGPEVRQGERLKVLVDKDYKG